MQFVLMAIESVSTEETIPFFLVLVISFVQNYLWNLPKLQTCHVFCFVLLSSSISSLRLLPVLSCLNLALYSQNARVCGCLCVCVCVCVYALKKVSMNKILNFTKTLIIIMKTKQQAAVWVLQCWRGSPSQSKVQKVSPHGGEDGGRFLREGRARGDRFPSGQITDS